MSLAEELSENRTLDRLLRDADKKASIVRSTLYEEADKSFLDNIKTGFMSLFGSTSDDESGTEETDIDEKDVDMTEEIAGMIQASIESTSAAASRAQSEEVVLQVRVGNVLDSLREDVSFELGRALELIENYDRIEFSTGKRRSRYDSERRKEIAKRVLGRLL
ncbi:MAG: hypothetical protein SGARI_000695 [Bacillariaceae sp.]